MPVPCPQSHPSPSWGCEFFEDRNHDSLSTYPRMPPQSLHKGRPQKILVYSFNQYVLNLNPVPVMELKAGGTTMNSTEKVLPKCSLWNGIPSVSFAHIFYKKENEVRPRKLSISHIKKEVKKAHLYIYYVLLMTDVVWKQTW